MKNSIFILFILLLFQCTKENQKDYINCIGEADVPEDPLNCDKPRQEFCEYNALGTYSLDPSSKKYLPLFCSDNGSKIRYQNHNGKEIVFTLIKKYNRQLASIYSEICPSDSLRRKGSCLIIDQVGYTLVEPNGLEIKIRLLTIPDPIKQVGYVGDVLDISRKTGYNSYWGEFNAVVNQRTLTYEKTKNQEFYANIEISGRNYKNVISYKYKNISNPSYQYYYNNEIGLIAFQDTTGVTWTLKE